MIVFFVKQKTAYEMRINDFISDVCSSYLLVAAGPKAGLARPEAAEAPSKPLQLFRPKNPKVPGLRTAPPSSRNSQEGAAPPLSGAFTCKNRLAGNCGGDNRKLPKNLEILCIVSPVLHNCFTTCPQLCPQRRAWGRSRHLPGQIGREHV